MVKLPFRKRVFAISFYLFLFSPPALFAQPRYNVIKDYGFENNDTIWVEYTSAPYTTVAKRHVKPGYESQYSGWTNNFPAGSGLYYCYLEQKLVNRVAKDYNLDKNLKYYFKLYPPNQAAAYDYWYISFSSQEKKLILLYAGANAGRVPKENDTTHIVEMDIPFTDSSWVAETLNFYEKWTEKFSETDTIEKLRLAGYDFADAGQSVNWDDIVFESTRPDSDAAVVDVGFSDIPSATIQNKGAVVVNFPTICDIFQGSTRVYSDTVNVDSLAVDSIKQVSFKLYSDTGEMKIYTALPNDQNPGNDTLSKNLSVQEVVIKKPIEFRVWPTLTRGMVNISSPCPIRIFNSVGREVTQSGRGLKKFDLASSGVYFIKSGTEIKKIVKIE